MNKLILVSFFALITSTSIRAQGFEGTLQTSYTDASGILNAAEIRVKADKYYIRRLSGGCAKYDTYICDMAKHTTTCFVRASKKAIAFNEEKVIDIYDKNPIKPGYKLLYARSYKNGNTKQIGSYTGRQKTSSDCEIWSTQTPLHFSHLVPFLRLAGFWGTAEDGENLILEAVCTDANGKKEVTKVTVQSSKIDDKLFEVARDIEITDLARFMSDQQKSPTLPALVKSFTSF